MLLLSPRPRQVRRRWVSVFRSSLKRIRHSVATPTKRQVRRSSQVWVSFTLRSSLTDFSVSSRLRLTSVNPRLLTEKQSQLRQTLIASIHVSQAVRVSTVTLRLRLSRIRKRASSSLTLSSAVLFRRSTFLLLRPVLRAQCSQVFSQDILLLTLRSLFMMDLIMRSTPQKWRLRSPVLWHSRTL